MADFTEAPASNTFKVKSPAGFEHMFTMRDESVKELLIKIDTVEKALAEKGWTPLAQNQFGKKERQVDYVEGRQCPKCGNKLVHTVTKAGKKFIKCETNKWDFANKVATGCDWTEWPQSIAQTIPEVQPYNGSMAPMGSPEWD